MLGLSRPLPQDFVVKCFTSRQRPTPRRIVGAKHASPLRVWLEEGRVACFEGGGGGGAGAQGAAGGGARFGPGAGDGPACREAARLPAADGVVQQVGGAVAGRADGRHHHGYVLRPDLVAGAAVVGGGAALAAQVGGRSRGVLPAGGGGREEQGAR